MKAYHEFDEALADWRLGGGAMCHTGAYLVGEVPIWQVGTVEEVAEVVRCTPQEATIIALLEGGQSMDQVHAEMHDWAD